MFGFLTKVATKMIGGKDGSVSAKDVLSTLDAVVDKYVETDEEKQGWKKVKHQVLAKSDDFQHQLNEAALKAKKRTLYMAGWRPFIAWTCGVTLACTWMVFPMLKWAVIIVFTIRGDVPPELPMPELNAAAATTMISALLGLTGVRTYEKNMGLSK